MIVKHVWDYNLIRKQRGGGPGLPAARQDRQGGAIAKLIHTIRGVG